MRMEIEARDFEADARLTNPEPLRQSLERDDRIFEGPSSPADNLVRERVRLELVCLPGARKHREWLAGGAHHEALEFLVAFGVTTCEPMDRNRMDDDQPVEAGGRHGRLQAATPFGEFPGCEIVFRHRDLLNQCAAR